MGSRLSVAAAAACGVVLAMPAPASETADWVATSNQHTKVVLDVLAKYSPEGAGGLGVDGLDEEVSRIGEDVYRQSMRDIESVLAELESRLEAAEHPLVRQDLGILIQSLKDNVRSTELNRDYAMPYFNAAGMVFGGLSSLLNPQQEDASRYPAAVVRLEKYAGLAEGYEPITEQARRNYAERMEANPDLQPPYRGQVEQDLQRAKQFMDGIPQLFESRGLDGWQEGWEALQDQLTAYNDWVREEILPQAADDFRQPRELYEDGLKQWGVYATPEDLIERAAHAIRDIRNEMEALAPLVAEEKGWDPDLSLYEVVKKIQSDQLGPESILPAYEQALAKIEERLRANQIISIPQRPAGIRIATEAETAQQPAPHLQPPRLIGNTGEYPYFVLPKLQPDAEGNLPQSDDLARATTWTLTAHEARPGHEMQFSTMIETGVSQARAIFAFNSANVEGWALYAEAITKPYMPLDAQLISLQNRLVRGYRMLLDPMLNLGMITPERAKEVLLEDAMILEGWAQNEIERYTYRIPGQATAYYYGYSRLQSIRTKAEIALGERFDQKAFHDFVLAQGLLPYDLLEKAVMTEFVGS